MALDNRAPYSIDEKCVTDCVTTKDSFSKFTHNFVFKEVGIEVERK